MKKKFINGLLMVALFVGFTSSMVSCKDYDDEKITNLEGVLADNVDALKKALADQKTDLETQINNVKNLYLTLEQNFLTFKQEINQKLKDYYTKKQTDSLDKILLDEIINRTSKEAVAKTVAELLNEGNNVMTTALDAYLNAFIDPYDKRIGDNEENIKTLQSEVIKLNQALDEARALAQAAQDLAKADSIRIDGLDELVAGLQNDVKDLRKDLTDVSKVANDAWAKALANEELIGKLQKSFDELSTTVQNNYTELKGLIEGNTKRIEALEKAVEENKEKIKNLEDDVKKYKAEADSIHKVLADEIARVDGDLTTFKGEVEQFKEAVNNRFLEIIQAVLGIRQDMKKLITSIEINGTYNPMYGELALPFNIRSNMLVVFRGSISDRGLQFPSLASHFAALPDQWNSGNFTAEDMQMLGIDAFSKIKGYVTIGENEDIVANQYVDEQGEVQVKEGNAGTIYLTINPTDRDFSGTDFTLVNSLNEEVPAVLSPLKKSNHLLTFGYTRAGVDENETSANGFYETQVTVDTASAKKMALRLELDQLKDVVATFKNYKDGINLTTVMNGIYSNISNLLDASALKATWENSGTLCSTVSQYALGVAGVKPLSFGFAKDIHLSGIPGTQQAEDLLSNIIDVVVAGLPEMDFINRFSIDHLELGELDYNQEEAYLNATIIVHLGERYIESTGPKTATFWFPTYTITGTDGEYFHITNTHPEVTVTVNNAEDTDGDGVPDGEATITLHWNIYDFITSMGRYDTENYENIRDQFNQLLDQVNSFVGSVTNLNFATMGNNVLAQFQEFIDRINNQFSRFTEPNRFFRPTIVVVNNGKMVHLSTLSNYPTKVEGTSLAIIPSNFNAEMLSPAFKKFVAVTDVKKDGKSAKGGDATCKSVLDAANKTLGFKEVIDGGFNPISFTGKTGYSYEFIYSAVDFSGKIVTKKFYMTVK